ncbi:PTS system, cellobiose-specific IIA component [Spiroplasma litorale]|uniref:PTS system, cellobiose-specific IIA component n=1 Tax=Spiroplasma litorale TaxID=216942 RepID=A0A0K1W1J8_9MOLU|nr:PTS lactose/cellobiose transporter subunit IIA [Spiroplasma litorale]AKX33967.1 PTS system, cellobiose-specific IIA component [Spiroplasma litorale]
MADLNFEEISFTIIANAGEAKGRAINAIKLAKEGNFKEASDEMELSEKALGIAGHSHMDVISAEAAGEKIHIPVLFMHAEDQLLTTETVILLSKEMIELYKHLKEKK